MGTPVLGVGGGVKNGANLVLNINTWSITIKVDTVDTISFGSVGGWNTKISTFKDWSAKCDGKTDVTDTTGQLALINGLGSTFTIDFAVGATAAAGHWTGTGILVGIDPKSDAAGMNEVSYAFEGTGALTFATT
jgi:predicted secreted protein